MAAIKYKGTDGQWHLLNNILVSGINVVQTTGSSSADVMSQSAVTEAINSKQIEVDQTIDSGTSASTNAVSTSAVYGFVTSYTPSITVDQVLDSTTSASTNPVSSKAVYDAVTDNELVWTNAYVTLSAATSAKTDTSAFTAHTADTTIHHSHNNKAVLDSITGTVSSATEVNTALGLKADKADAVVSAVTVSSDLSNVTCPESITGPSKSGAQAIIVYVNNTTTTDYTVTVSTTYKSPDGEQVSLTCPKNGYCEVSYLNIGGTIYVRGI